MKAGTLKHSHMKHLLFAITVGLCLTGISSTAQAFSTFNLDLSTVGSAWQSSSDDGTSHFDFWSESLTGMPVNAPITVQNGDVINATVKLDQAITIPASQTWTFLGLYLWGPVSPGYNTANDASVAFFTGLTSSYSTQSGTTLTSDQIVPGVSMYGPNNGPITFDNLVIKSTITGLGNNTGDSLTLTAAELHYQLTNPSTNPPNNAVPEPASMQLMGMGLAGLVGLRRKFQRS